MAGRWRPCGKWEVTWGGNGCPQGALGQSKDEEGGRAETSVACRLCACPRPGSPMPCQACLIQCQPAGKCFKIPARFSFALPLPRALDVACLGYREDAVEQLELVFWSAIYSENVSLPSDNKVMRSRFRDETAWWQQPCFSVPKGGDSGTDSSLVSCAALG